VTAGISRSVYAVVNIGLSTVFAWASSTVVINALYRHG
jgi:hypothetical protein